MVALGTVVGFEVANEAALGVVIANCGRSPDRGWLVTFYLIQGSLPLYYGHDGDYFGFEHHPHAEGDMYYIWERDGRLRCGGSPATESESTVVILGTYMIADLYLDLAGRLQKLSFTPLPRSQW